MFKLYIIITIIYNNGQDCPSECFMIYLNVDH